MTVPKLMPPDAWLAATVNRLISVAVSKPSPNKKPIGNICQLRDTMRNNGRKMRARKPRPESRRSSSCSATGSPRRARRKLRHTPRRMTRLMAAMASRKNAEAPVPMMLPIDLKCSKRPCSANAVAAITATTRMTTSEWPSEKNRPTETGRLPSCISLRTTLSMAAM